MVVDHRVPDGAGVLEPLDVDRTVGGEAGQIVDPAVVHVEQAHLAVVDEQCRVTARPVADRGLDVDGDLQPTGKVDRLGVAGADEALEAEGPQHALQLVGRIARQEHGGRAVDVLSEEREIEVVPVEVRDVEEVRVLDGVTHVVGSWSLRGKGNHEPKKAGTNHGSQTMVPRAVSMRMPA